MACSSLDRRDELMREQDHVVFDPDSSSIIYMNELENENVINHEAGGEHGEPFVPALFPDDGEAIVRNIASFMTLSDAASLASMSIAMTPHSLDVAVTPADSWAVGLGWEHQQYQDDDGNIRRLSWTSLTTPPTPALVAVSPGATPAYPTHFRSSSQANLHLQQQQQQHHPHHSRVVSTSIGTGLHQEPSSDEDSDYSMKHFLMERRRKWAKEKLATAVFAHPHSLRSFCMDAYHAAQEIRIQQQQLLQKHNQNVDPETMIEPTKKQQQQLHSSSHRASKQDATVRLMHEIVDLLFRNVPLSVLLDVLDSVGALTLDTTFASFRLTQLTCQGMVGALGCTVRLVWETTMNVVSNPFKLLEMIISLQFNAMGKTSEVLVSGIQSVATGVESASSMALHKLSAANLSTKGGSTSSLIPGAVSAVRRARGNSGFTVNKKLLKKMSSINDAARVVSYMESGDDTGGLTRHAMSRTRRMMHYSVSLRPFVATVAVKPSDAGVIAAELRARAEEERQDIENGNFDDGSTWTTRPGDDDTTHDSSTHTHSNSPNISPVICSPQSFPPTPHSRQMVLARGSQFADDVVFLARDRLRIHDGLESSDDRTREMARALREGKRLAIFDGNGANGIELTCGQHIATKVGTMHYASTRSMVPVLRNCYVYFEITVMPRLPNDPLAQAPPLTLSIGVSTVEMPPNTLVGAWQGSIGLCTTGQIFVAGQWCSPRDPSMSAYGHSATVGCLVFLDDGSAFETWDGVMVNASVTFSINGVLVPPPVSAMALPGAPPMSLRPQSPVDSSRHSNLSDIPLGTSIVPGLGTSPPLSTPTPLPNGTIPPNVTQTLFVPASEELYPTVTLQTPATAVMCRFSSEDAIARSRESIGAPPDATVYAVDGTVLFYPEE